ncbi:MAG: nuclear transport factor 2 family protein [Caldilineaceae bacterium]
MNITLSVLGLLLLTAVVTGCIVPPVVASSTASSDAEASFRAFLPTFEQGTNDFMNGDVTRWLANASQSDQASIMGGWGAYEQGWDEVGLRYQWAVQRFLPSAAKLEVEYLATKVSGDLAYTVAIERSTVKLVDQAQPAPMALRVTHVFQRENGQWKLLHRHADPMMAKTAPDTVLGTE